MKKQFQTRLQAIQWIADYAKNEGHFEVLRERLLFNHIYDGTYYLDLDKQKSSCEVILFDSDNNNN
jgi:hypothetical protein